MKKRNKNYSLDNNNTFTNIKTAPIRVVFPFRYKFNVLYFQSITLPDVAESDVADL